MLASMTADEALRFISASFYRLDEIRFENGKVMAIRDSISAMCDEVEECRSNHLVEEDTQMSDRKPMFHGWLDLSQLRVRAISKYMSSSALSSGYAGDSSSGYGSSEDDEDFPASTDPTSHCEWSPGDVLTAKSIEDDDSSLSRDDLKEPQQQSLEIFPKWFIDIIVREVQDHLLLCDPASPVHPFCIL